MIDAEKASVSFRCLRVPPDNSIVLSFTLARLGLDQIAPDISPFTTFIQPSLSASCGFAPSDSAFLSGTAVAWWAFSSSAMHSSLP